MNLKHEIKSAIVACASLPELKELLILFKQEGGGREDAHMVLYELLQEANTDQEDFYLRELIDFTIGYSGKSSTIWL